MGIGIYSALSGMKVKLEELEMVAHNLANANTVGFKERDVAFSSVLAENMKPAGGEEQDTPFVKLEDHSFDLTQGAIFKTGNELDLAIQGDSFFEVQTDQGTFYTKNGSFTRDNTGKLVTQAGQTVMGQGGAIDLGTVGKVEISQSGTITVDGQDRGAIKLVKFADSQMLEAKGGNLFAAKPQAQPTLDESPNVLQGQLENSNTNMMKNIVKLIDISRQYQTYQKVLNTQSDLDKTSATEIGQVS